MNFLSSEDRHDLFEFIKKINPNLEMIHEESQNLLDAIDKKMIKIHGGIWENMVTISFIGNQASGKISFMQKVLNNTFPGWAIVELNHENYYIRYAKIEEITPCKTCPVCGERLEYDRRIRLNPDYLSDKWDKSKDCFISIYKCTGIGCNTEVDFPPNDF